MQVKYDALLRKLRKSDEGSGGAVDSVNGQTGVVVLDAADVGAAPALGADENYVTDAEKANLHAPGSDNQDLSGLLPTTHLTDFDHSLIPTALQSETDPVFTAWDKDYDDLTNKPTIPSPYTLPTADATTLGGIKVGDRLTMAAGVLSADVQTTDISGKENVGVAAGLITTHQSTYDHSLLHAPGSDNQDLSGLVPKTYTVNTKPLSGNITLNQDEVGDGTTYKQYSATEKTKLAGIEAGANNYTHPATHSADIITDGTTNKAFTATEKTKLAGIAEGAEVNVQADWNAASGDAQILNKPTIPDQLSDLSDDATHRLVTDTEKSTWNSKAAGDHNHTGVYAPALGADDNYVTDAEKTKLSNLSGTNTGDQTRTSLGIDTDDAVTFGNVTTPELYLNGMLYGAGPRLTGNTLGSTVLNHYTSSWDMTGYSWQGSPFATPTNVTTTLSDYGYVYNTNLNTRSFYSKAITNGASSWQGKYAQARVRVGANMQLGVRIDDGTDNTYAQTYLKSLNDGTYKLCFAWRNNAGSITTVESAVIKPCSEYTILRVYCASNYAFWGYILAEDGSTVNVTSFNTGVQTGIPAAGRVGIMTDCLASAQNPGFIDWYHSTFT